MDQQQILEHVRSLLLSVHSSLCPENVTECASMTADLGLDSLSLELLIARLKDEVADIEFTPWYIKASRHGHDTVGSLVAYINAHQATSHAAGVSQSESAASTQPEAPQTEAA